MWNATLLHKEIRTDGGVDFIVSFTDGVRTLQKTLTFFGDFDFIFSIKKEIRSIMTTYQNADAIELGDIVLPADGPIPVNVSAGDIITLRKLESALSLGLVDQKQVDDQIAIVKQNPDFLQAL